MVFCYPMASKAVKQFLSKIGKIGGKKSRRVLSREQALEMIRIREENKKAKNK